MWRDEILEEIHTIRAEHALNYDLAAICDDLRKRQTASGRKIISRLLRQPHQSHSESLHSTR